MGKEQKGEPSALRIHCPVFNHYKNTIVCSLCCTLRDRCKDFQSFYTLHREEQDQAVDSYIAKHRKLPPDSLLMIQYRLEVKGKMNDTYIWIGQDDLAQVMTLEQVLQAAEDGRKPKHIFQVKQELMLRYQLIPKNRRDDKLAQEAQNEAPDDRKRSKKAVA